jgi:hypothetical protein
MNNRWRIWFRTISRIRCGRWRAFFIIDGDEAEAIETLDRLRAKGNEYMSLPDGEKPMQNAIVDGDEELV